MSLKKAIDQYTPDGQFVQTWPCIADACREYNGHTTNISAVLNMPAIAYGYLWKSAIIQPTSSVVSASTMKMRHDYTEEQRQDFNRRIIKYEKILFKLLHSYDFVNEDNWDDYLQEALTCAWIRFHTYNHKRPGDIEATEVGHFSKWFKTNCHWGIIQYYHYCKQWWASKVPDNYLNLEEFEEEDHTTALTLALFNSLQDLKGEDMLMVNLFLAGKKVYEMAKELGKSKQACHHNWGRIMRILREKMDHYFHGIQQSRSVEIPKGLPKPVEQLDMKGNFIAWYPSANSARSKGFTADGISSVIRKKNVSHRGFKWRFSDHNYAPGETGVGIELCNN